MRLVWATSIVSRQGHREAQKFERKWPSIAAIITKETSVTYKPGDIHEKANQMENALWSLVFAAIAAYLVSTFGTGAPWWVYPLLFARSVYAFVQALTNEPAGQKATDARFADSARANRIKVWTPSPGMFEPLP